MVKVMLSFGTLNVLLEDDKKSIKELNAIALHTLLALIPRAERILAQGAFIPPDDPDDSAKPDISASMKKGNNITGLYA